MKFVLASHNRKKLAEMQEILGELGVEVVLQSDVGLDLEPEENGTTFAANAAIKAMAVMQASGLPAIAAAADGLITHPENDDIDWTPDEFVSDWNDLHRGEEPLK